jgi:hypothetical protein
MQSGVVLEQDTEVDIQLSKGGNKKSGENRMSFIVCTDDDLLLLGWSNGG